MCGRFLYVLCGNNQHCLCAYDWVRDSWTELLPSPPTDYSTLANVRNTLLVIGGFLRNTGDKTNRLHDLSTAGGNYVWAETYPPMPTRRDSVAATCYGSYLVVAGGIERSYLRTVEVLQVEDKQWLRAASLPTEIFSGSASICGDCLYLLGGWVALSTITYSVMTCSLRDLINSCRDAADSQLKNGEGEPNQGSHANGEGGGEGVWTFAPMLPVTKSSCVSFRGQLLAVGGQLKNGEPTGKIWRYDAIGRQWAEFGECLEARSQCYVAALPDDQQLVVAGGFTGRNFTGETNTTELAALRQEK